MTRMLIGLFGIFCALWSHSAQARGLRAAIFDFELIDTSLEGATNGPRADETARLARLGDQLRALVKSSGKLEVIDIAPVRAEAPRRTFRHVVAATPILRKSLALSFRSLVPFRRFRI